MLVPHPIPDELAELIARRFRTLADPLRVRLLDQLRDDELSVNELAERLASGQQNVSKHLGVLLYAGIVGRRKQGTFVYYRIVDEVVFDLCQQVCASIERRHRELGQLLATTVATNEGR